MIPNDHPTLTRIRQARPKERELIGNGLKEAACCAGATWEQIKAAEEASPIR
jgi:hypothetical protein